MVLSYSKLFIKQVNKLKPEARKKLQERITIFCKNPLSPILRNHALNVKYKEYRSIDVTGGIRALYLQSDDEAIFDAVGTHSQLYD
jgi:mRNA-degrading endonuclease YafQ of YafQ-DinJ toxin-antitoxin module